MANHLFRPAGLFTVIAIASIATGSAPAAGWGMMGGQGSSMMGGGAGPGMMQGYGGYGRFEQREQGGSGQAVFASACASCHDIRQDARGGDGPNLHDVFGRRAGSVPNYDYSPAMRRAGIVWNMANLNRFIADPAGFIAGNRMPFSGIRDGEERKALLSYLRTATR